IGIRKAIGARRRQLMGQFFVESLFFTGLAFGLALLVVESALPFVCQLLGIEMDLWQGKTGLAAMTSAILCLGMLAGSYPAFFLSRPAPVVVLKGRQNASGTSRTGNLRKMLVVTQFACSVVLIFATLVVHKQLGFMQSHDLGFNKDHVITLPMSVMGME